MTAESKRCVTCGEEKPANTYYFKPRGSGLTGSCRECLNAWQRAWHRKRRAAEIEAAGVVEIPQTRECSRCQEHKPLSREFFDARKDCMYGLATVCILCRRAEQRNRWHGDPEYRARRLVAMRMDRRLRAEKQNGDLGNLRRDLRATEPFRDAAGHAAQVEGLPVEPLALWVDEVQRLDGRDHGDLAEAMGIGERRLYGIERREFSRVSLGVADKMIWGYAKAVVLRSERLEEILRERWQNAPGNGERILGYLDEAERLAYLADVVVDRVEDLWPELA